MAKAKAVKPKKVTNEEPRAASGSEQLEKQLWKAADKLRKNIDAAEYKHVVLGLIFLKYISENNWGRTIGNNWGQSNISVMDY